MVMDVHIFKDAKYIMLAAQPCQCQYQDIIMRDNENINSEAQLVVNPVKEEAIEMFIPMVANK